MTLRRFVKKLPGVLQTEVQKEFYAATFDQLFNPANVEAAQGFIGRRTGDVLDPLVDNYLEEPTKNRAAYQLEPIAYAVNAALEDTNQYFYEDILNYVSHKGGNIENHDRLFADNYYSFAPPIDVDKYLNYQNYLWLPGDGTDPTNTAPIGFLLTDGATTPAQYDAIIESQIIGATTFNTSQDTRLVPQNFEFTSGMRIQFSGSLSYNRPYYIEGVGRSIRLVEEQSVVYPSSDVSITLEAPSEPTLDPAASQNLLATPDYITVERGSIEGSAWSRSNRWFHEDSVDAITQLGQLQGGTIIQPGNGYDIGDVLLINIGDGVGGSFVVTSVGLGGTIDGIAVFTRGSGYNFAIVDETGVPSPITELAWDNEDPFGLGSAWDPDNELANPSGYLTTIAQDETDFNENLIGGSVSLGGSGYTVGDTLTIIGGTGTPATFNVDTVEAVGGAVTGISIISSGSYSAIPTTPADTSGGTGIGCTINLLINGTFDGGSAFLNPADISKFIAMSDGTIIQIDAIVANAITEFTIISSSSTVLPSSGQTLTMAGTNGSIRINTNSSGEIVSAKIVDKGAGYHAGGVINVTTLGGAGGQITYTVANGRLDTLSVTSIGSGYTADSVALLAGDMPAATSTDAAGTGFEMTLATANERGVTLWDDNTITSGTGAGTYIEGNLAAAVSRANKAERPILEFKRDLDMYDAGWRGLGTVDVAAETEDFGDIEGATSGTTQVDGVTLATGMKLIFLDPDSIVTFLQWDETPGTDNDQWDEAPWESSGSSGAITRFVWEVDASGPTITLNKYDMINEVAADVNVEVGDVVTVTSGDTWAGYDFYQSYDDDREEFYWRSGQQKLGLNQAMLYSLFDTNGIPLGDELEYPDSTYAGSEIFSYKLLTQERLNELGGGTLIDDPVLGFPLETKGFRQLGDVIFENDLETQRENYTPVGETETEIRGYYYFRQYIVDIDRNLNPPAGQTALPFNEAIITVNDDRYQTNWLTSSLPEEQRVIDRYLTTSDTQDVFPVSVSPPVGSDACLVVAQGRRLNTSEFAYLRSSQEVQLFGSPIEYDAKVGTGTTPTFTFDIQENFQLTVDGVYQELGVDYNFLAETPGAYSVEFTFIPASGTFIQATNRPSGAPGIDQVVEILTCTFDSLPDDSIGYFEIPNGLENNPNNLEIEEQSWNEFTPHFTSIITEQEVYEGDAFGAGNNYRDTAKDGSLGTFALQSQAPLLKTMLCASDSSLDIVDSIRFSSEEYTRFKNKYVKTAQQLINEGFQAFSSANPIDVSEWVDEILRRITRGREFADAFSDTYMIAWNNVYQEQVITAPGLQTVFTTTNFVDLADKRNVMYVYVDGVIQLLDRDYEISNTNPIQVTLTTAPDFGAELVIRLYENSASAHIPATPTKLGLYPSYRPRVETDNTYLTPAEVIVGHDGSRTPIYGSVIDDLLVELEARIYNGIIDKFRVAIESGDNNSEYNIPLKVDTYKPGKFRSTRWELDEWNDLIKQSFYKWSATNRTDYITNNYYDNTNEWSYNYGETLDRDGALLPSGYWRGIFDYYYDTQTPESTPWEMLGFTEQPIWWENCTDRIGDRVPDDSVRFTGYGAGPWAEDHFMWIDIEEGRIRREYDPVAYQDYLDINGLSEGSDTLFPNWVAGSVDARYARPNLVANYLPVDATGALKADPLAAIDTSDSLVDPTAAQAQEDYTWSDWSPIEYAWRTSESYPYAAIEALFLARPGEFGEQFWDPEHIFEVPVDREQVVNDENDLRKRIGNDELYVHGEPLNDVLQVNTGYQVWITSRLRTLKKDPAVDFGALIRTLDVKLGHKMAGFTDKDTLRVFVEGISVSSAATNLLVPSENIDVALYTGAPANDYFYGGVLIKALDSNTYQVFGYDILKGQFDYYERDDVIGTSTVNVGGNPEAFRVYENGNTYQQGEIVKLNGIFYRALETHESNSFDPSKWSKLQALPITGGLSVTHKPNTTGNVLTLKYGEKIIGTQAMFDFLIGWGDYLEQEGWTFEDVGANGEINDWYKVAKDFLLWAGTSWETGSLIMLSPGGEKAVLNALEGYPGNVERISNGVYSILNKEGVAIDPVNTVINREDRLLEVEPNVAQTGIYGLRVSTFETENIITFDNVTVFNDTLYDPVLGSRLARLDFRGRRTLDWTGKLEAAGFIITADGLLPNYENMVDSIRNYHNTEVQLDQPDIENTARHLIGFDDRDYFTDLGVLDDAQFQFYQGLIRQKGTRQAIEKLERNKLVTSVEDELNVIEEWALKVGELAGVCKNQYTEFLIAASEVKVDPQLVQLSYPSTNNVGMGKFFDGNDVDDDAETFTITAHGLVTGDKVVYTDISQSGTSTITGLTSGTGYSVIVVDDNTIQLAQISTPTTAILLDAPSIDPSDQYSLTTYIDGRVTSVEIVSTSNTYTIAPNIFFINHPDDTTGSGVAATSVLDTDGTLLRIDIISQGSGYTEPPIVSIGNPVVTAGDDRAISRVTFDIATDIASDDVILIDIDDETRWITKPAGTACDVAAELWPDAPLEVYRTTNAGYVHKDDVTFTSFDRDAVDNIINNTTTAFEHGQTIWIARDPRETFGVYFMDNYRASTIDAQDETNFDNVAPNGTFVGGTGYSAVERIIMSDGTEIIVDTVDGSGVVLTFTIDQPSSSPFPARGSHTLTAVSSNVNGNNDFTLTIGTANEESGSSLTGDAATITMTGDGAATLTSLPREDVIKAQFEIGVSGSPSGDVTSVTVVDGGFGYTTGGTFTVSRDTYGDERSTNDTDAIVTYTVGNGVVTSAEVTTAGSGYGRNVDTVALNAAGSGYSIGDSLTLVGGTLLYGAATFDVTELTTIATQNETNFDGIPANEGTFTAGTGHAAGDIITLTDGSTITVDAATISTIQYQTEANFDNVGSNGTYAGGGGYILGDFVTLQDGTTIQVTSIAAGVIDGFKITSTTTSTNIGSGDTITQASTSGQGTGFSITLDTNNEQTTSDTGIVTDFTVTTASTTGITTDSSTLTQSSTDGLGVGFSVTLGTANQGVNAVSTTLKGSYSTTTPGASGVATTVLPSGGTGCTLDLTYTGTGITVLADDVTAPIGWGRYLGNAVPGSGTIFAGGALYDYTITTGLNVTLQKDGEDVEETVIADGTPFFTLMNVRFGDTIERRLFGETMQFVGVDTIWTDDDGTGKWSVGTVDGFITPTQSYDVTVGDYGGNDHGFTLYGTNQGSILPSPALTLGEDNKYIEFVEITFYDAGGVEMFWDTQNPDTFTTVPPVEIGASILFSTFSTIEVDYNGGTEVLSTVDTGSGGDLSHGSSAEGADYVDFWFPSITKRWGAADIGLSYEVRFVSPGLDPTLTVTRSETDLIETDKFENAYVYEALTKDTLAQIPVYDPFKGILPGNAAQNITYIRQRDPARYSFAVAEGDTDTEAVLEATRLVNADLLFDGDQLGQLWWDTSTSAYLYYEQGTDTYRRDNWGKLFPGSSVDIYEWSRSTDVPANWDGDGTVRSTTEYVQKEEWDPILEEVRTFYYFWVKDRTEIPNGIGRTVAAFEVANILTNPVANLYQWFSPISQSAFMFAGVDGVFTDSNNIFQINYRRTDDERPTHVEWELGRDSDVSYEINDIHWNKMVDSLCGFTDEIDITAKAYTDITASFNTDNTGIDTPAANNITTLEPHGLTNGAGVVYSKNGGTANIGLTEGTMYYVEVISDSVFAVHAAAEQAYPVPPVLVNPASRLPVFTSGSEVHTVTESTTTVNNYANALPTAADQTRGYLVVPDPMLSETQQLGIKVRPMQSMFSDIQAARRVWRDKVNELTNDLVLRDLAPTWNASLSTNNLWEWVDWYADGYDETNTVPVRQVDDTSDLALLDDPLDGDLVKVTGTRYSVYEYDAENDIYNLVAREESRLNILADVYTNDPTLEIAIELREIIQALRDNVFIGELFVYNNSVFFAILNYVFSEQDDLDWAFKTTYIFLDQTGRQLEQERVFQEDPFDAALEYITEAKPYHSKIRDFRITRQTATDLAPGTADETARTITPFMIYDQIRGGDLSVTEMRIAKYMMAQDASWKGYTTLYDLDGSSVDVRLGAAGRAVNNYRDVLGNIQGPTGGTKAEFDITIDGSGFLSSVTLTNAGSGYTDGTSLTFNLTVTQGGGDGLAIIQYDVVNGQVTNPTVAATGSGYTPGAGAVDADDVPTPNTGTTLAEFNPIYTGTATTDDELVAVSTINAAITEEFFFDYQGSLLINTSFGGLPTLDSFALATNPTGSGYVVGEILSLDAGSGVPVSNALFRVEAVDGGGGITSLSLVNGGSYTQTPTVDPVDLNGGSGTGAQVTTLIFENGSAVPWDSTPYDQIGFESSAGDESVTALTGSPDGLATTIPGQSESDYDGTGENGSFVAGSAYTTGAANGGVPYTAGLAWADNSPALDTITRTDGNSFVTTDGIEAGMQIIVSNANTASNNGTYTIDSVTDTVITLATDSQVITDATDTTATFTFHDVIGMTDGTDVRVDAVSTGAITQFTIINGSESFLPSNSTITQLSVSGGTGSDFQLTLGVANETSGTFADVPAEEQFSGTGNQKEFTITTDVPTFFMFAVVDGVQQVLNVDYFFIGDVLTFVSILDTNGQRAFGAPPAGTDNVELYTYIEAGDLINPQVTAGITEEMVPLDPRENLVLLADTTSVVLTAGGTGYSVNDEVEVVGGTRLQSTIAAQTEANFDGAASNGTFDGGFDFRAGDTIRLVDTTVITVDTVDGSGTVTGFTIDTASGRGFLTGSVINQDSTYNAATDPVLLDGATWDIGAGFQLLPDSNNEANFGNPMTIRVDSVSGGPPGPIVTFTVLDQGDYYTYPTSPVSVTDTVGGGNNDATFTLATHSFKLHNDTLNNLVFTRNADSASTTLTSNVSTSDGTIPVVSTAGLSTATRQDPQIVWIGTERIVYHGQTATSLTGVLRGTNGTHPQRHWTGDKAFDGGTTQDIPVSPYVYWVDSATASYASSAGFDGEWRYHGNNLVHFVLETAASTIHTTNSIVVGDAFRPTSGTYIQNSYFIKDLIAIGEASKIDVVDAGTGYSVGDVIDVSALNTALSPATSASLVVQGVDVNGGITHVGILNRGNGYTAGSLNFAVSGGDGLATITVYTDREGLALAIGGDIISPSGVVVERNNLNWAADRALPGGLLAATTPAAAFIQGEAGNALPVPAS